MVILHGPAHTRRNFKKYLLSKEMLFQLYTMKKEAHLVPLLKEVHALNVYQINILQILTFMQKVKRCNSPSSIL